MSSAERARCAAIDSGRAQLPVEQLPLSLPAGRPPQLPTPPRDAQPGWPVRTTFRVRPDGWADTSSVAVEGTEDPDYRRAMVRVLSKQRFVPPTVDGCPVSGHGDIRVVGIPGAVRARP